MTYYMSIPICDVHRYTAVESDEMLFVPQNLVYVPPCREMSASLVYLTVTVCLPSSFSLPRCCSWEKRQCVARSVTR